jgi:hypothetical protein
MRFLTSGGRSKSLDDMSEAGDAMVVTEAIDLGAVDLMEEGEPSPTS